MANEDENAVVPGDGQAARDNGIAVVPANVRKRPHAPRGPFLVLHDINAACFTENEFTKFEELGRGGQGTVTRRTNNILGGVCAVKIFDISNGRLGEGCDLDDVIRSQPSNQSVAVDANDAKRELQFTQQAAYHQNIVSLYGYVQKEIQKGKDKHKLFIGIVMEYMPGGTVQKMVEINPTHFTEKIIISYALDIARALAFCHDKRSILHRDVKPLNILLTEVDKDGKRTAKLSDFGYAREHNEKQPRKTKNKGCLLYMAPEMIQNDSNEQLVEYGFEADVWNFAMLVYFMTFKREPFEAIDLISESVHRQKLTGTWRNAAGELDTIHHRPDMTEWPTDYHAEFKEDIKKLIISGWSTAPETRPPMVELVDKLTQLEEKYRNVV